MTLPISEPDTWSAEDRASVAAVQKLLAALISRDQRLIAAALTPDAVFTMGPIGALPPPARADFAALLSGITSVEIDVHKTFASGPVVMMDRTDRLVWPDRTMVGRWIGIFAVKEGRVAEFTDYTIERCTTP